MALDDVRDCLVGQNDVAVLLAGEVDDGRDRLRGQVLRQDHGVALGLVHGLNGQQQVLGVHGGGKLLAGLQ